MPSQAMAVVNMRSSAPRMIRTGLSSNSASTSWVESSCGGKGPINLPT